MPQNPMLWRILIPLPAARLETSRAFHAAPGFMGLANPRGHQRVTRFMFAVPGTAEEAA